MESQTDRRAVLAAAAGLGGMAMLARKAHAGPLTPPGAPSSTGRTTAEIYDDVQAAGGSRTPINTLPAGGGFLHQITQPGAYVLTSDIVVSGSSAILVSANDVDIDFNGFSLINSSNTSGPGITVATGFSRTRIHNGAIRGTYFALSLKSESIVERMRISGFGERAIGLADDSIVRNCLVRGGFGVQVFGGNRCVLVDSVFTGSSAVIAGDSLHVDRCTFEDTAGSNFGIQCGINARISNCIVRGYAVAGITTNDSSIVEGCMLNNNGDGVVVGDNAVVRGNNIDFHPSGTAILVQGARARIVENHISRASTGIFTTGGQNIAYGNTLSNCDVVVDSTGSNNSTPLITTANAFQVSTPFVNLLAI